MLTTHFKDIRQVIINELLKSEKSIWLASAYFTDKYIFQVLCTLATRGIEVKVVIADEPANFVQKVLNYGELVQTGGFFFLANRTPYNSLMHHKFCIIDKAKVLTGSYNYTLKAQENIENIVVIDSTQVANDYINEFNNVIENYSTQMLNWNDRFLPSGFSDIDRITNGFHTSELTCIAARPSMGTTSFALSIIYNLSTSFKHSVGYITTSLTTKQVGNRYTSIYNNIELSKVQHGSLEEYDWQLIHSKFSSTENGAIDISYAETIEEIETRCKIYSYDNIELIIIDKINSIFNNNYNNEFYNYSRGILDRLKSLSRLVRIPIILIYSIPLKENIKHSLRSYRPTIDELSLVYNHANTIILLNRLEQYGIEFDEENLSTVGIAEISIPKQFEGSTGLLKLKFNKKSLKFEDFDYDKL